MRDVVVRHQATADVDVMATREGLVAFDFAKWKPALILDASSFDQMAEAQRNRTLLMNAFLALLYSAVLKRGNLVLDRMLATPECLISLDRLDPGSNMGCGNTATANLVTSSYTLMPADLPLISSPNSQLLASVSSRTPINPADITEACDLLSGFIEAHGIWGLIMLDLVQRASCAFQAHYYEATLIDYWAVSERLISELWKAFSSQLAARQRVDSSRRARLADSRTFTVAVVTEILAIDNVIATALYEQLSRVRKARNDWIHGASDRVTRLAAIEATEVCEKLFEQALGVAVAGHRGSKLHC